MKSYIVSYDLRNHRDYESLYKAIKSYGTYNKVIESLWIVVTSDSAKQIRDYLVEHIDGDDGLIVIKSGVEGAWRNVDCSSQWLKDNL